MTPEEAQRIFDSWRGQLDNKRDVDPDLKWTDAQVMKAIAIVVEAHEALVPSADLDRLRAVERAAREYLDAPGRDIQSERNALRAALGDRAAEEGPNAKAWVQVSDLNR